MVSDDQPNIVRRERIAGINRQAGNNCSAASEILLMMTGGIMRPIALISGRDELSAGRGWGIGRGALGNKIFGIDPEPALQGAWSAP